MNKREYPLFLIDRSKNAGYPFDYVSCFDRECGFVGRVVQFPTDEMYNTFIEQSINTQDGKIVYTSLKTKRGGIVLIIEDFLYYFEWTAEIKGRIQTLLKKAFKKYIHAEIERTPFGETTIDEQIKAQQLTIERAKQNYPDLLQRCNGDKKAADYNIKLAEDMLNSLKMVKKMHDEAMQYFRK
ncbi:MAG: hypothetical protein ACRC9X_04875 [Bacteroidales bacterium]